MYFPQSLTCVYSTVAEEQIDAGPPDGERRSTGNMPQPQNIVTTLKAKLKANETKLGHIQVKLNYCICGSFNMCFHLATPGFGVRFCFLFILTMRKNALHHELLSTWRQSPERATDRPAS